MPTSWENFRPRGDGAPGPGPRRWRWQPAPHLLLDLGPGQTGPSSQLPAYAPVVHLNRWLRSYAPALPGRTDAARLLRPVRRRRGGGHLGLCGDRHRASSAPRHRSGPAHRLLHARDHAGFHAYRVAVLAVRDPPPGRLIYGPLACADLLPDVPAVASEKTSRVSVARGRPP